MACFIHKAGLGGIFGENRTTLSLKSLIVVLRGIMSLEIISKDLLSTVKSTVYIDDHKI